MQNEMVFHVQHYYEIDEVDYIKLIGIFSTLYKAKKAVNKLKSLSGFRDHPEDCFLIEKTKLDLYEWRTGFVTSNGMDVSNFINL